MRTSRLMFSLMCLCALLSMIGCGWRQAPDGTVMAVPHTGNVYPVSQSLLVAPDENWLVFFESAIEDIGRVDGLASIDLDDTTYTKINIEQIRRNDTSRSMYSLTNELTFYLDGYGRIGWSDEHLVVAFTDNRTGVYVARGKHEAWIDRIPGGGLYVSDGVAFTDMMDHVRKIAKRRDINIYDYPVCTVMNNGELKDILYWYDVKSRWIWRSASRTETERLWRNKGRPGRIVNVSGLRVSPDERYIAIKTKEQLAGPLPTPYYRTTMLVLEIATGRTVQVGRYRHVANCMWSQDGARLYFAGGGDTDSFAVRVAHVDKMFKK